MEISVKGLTNDKVKIAVYICLQNKCMTLPSKSMSLWHPHTLATKKEVERKRGDRKKYK